MRVVVFGWGNESRGDDALGPLLLRRVEAARLADVATVEDYQLQIEHALDLDEADLALFVDAARNSDAPLTFKEIFADAEVSHTSHALAPEAVLNVFQQVRGRAPPPAFALAMRGEGFELGADVSPQAAQTLEAAWVFIARLLVEPDVETWRRSVIGAAPIRTSS